MGKPTPEQLLAQLADGHEAAYVALYRQFAERLFRTAGTLLNRREDAEDAVQDVFTSLVRSRRQLRGVKDLSGYLFAALRHAAGRIAMRREREHRQQWHEPPSCEVSRASTLLADRDAQHRAWLRESVARLPYEQREIIALKIDGELTFAAIAQALNISPNTAASRYRYALEKLRAAVSAEMKQLE